jgi:hypothetical protein
VATPATDCVADHIGLEGSVREYSMIEETIAPSVVELISGWIKTHTS